MNKSSNMNDSDSLDGGGGNELEEEMNINNTKLVNNNGNDLLERIYDEVQGGKFNDLIKNPTKIKAVKAFITDDDLDNMLNLPPDKTKSGFGEVKDGGMSGTMNHVSGNMQDLLSITGFKIIDKLPPTSGEIKDQTYSMIDRFRLSFNDFDSTNGNNTLMNATKSKWTNNGDLEPKLSRPTTTIINCTCICIYCYTTFILRIIIIIAHIIILHFNIIIPFIYQFFYIYPTPLDNFYQHY